MGSPETVLFEPPLAWTHQHLHLPQLGNNLLRRKVLFDIFFSFSSGYIYFYPLGSNSAGLINGLPDGQRVCGNWEEMGRLVGDRHGIRGEIRAIGRLSGGP